MRFISVLVLMAAAFAADAAMVRVVAVEDGRTIVVERNGARERVRLAGVNVIDDPRARELLRWTALDAWVMLEAAGRGEALVYRSPDALFLNRELVVRGFARATLPGIEPDLRAPARYLGDVNLPPRSARTRTEVSDPPASRTGSDTSRRSKAPRSRSSRRPRTSPGRAPGR